MSDDGKSLVDQILEVAGTSKSLVDIGRANERLACSIEAHDLAVQFGASAELRKALLNMGITEDAKDVNK